jgi:FkbM family methyltransferase
MGRLRGAIKDWQRRRALARAGVRLDVEVALASAGARSGTWHFDAWRLGPQSVAHCYGCGDNLAFDVALAREYAVHVHAFDPTPRSRAHVERLVLPARLVFHPLGIAAHDGSQLFAAPAKERDVNFAPLAAGSAAPRALAAGVGAAGSGAAGHVAAGPVELPVRRYATIARELGHTRVDLVKLDIEGGEYAVLPDLLDEGPPPGQILVEFHHGEREHTLADTLAAIALLRARGYRLAHVSTRGLEFTFLRA